jgi:hypothetical protein
MRRILKNINDPILRKELEAIWDRLNYVETKTVEPTTATLAPGEMAVYNGDIYVNDRQTIRQFNISGGDGNYLKADGSVDLTGNLDVDAGITIDGVDISAHAANTNAHHPAVTPGGTDKQIQFKDGTVFAGFGSWDKTLFELTVPGKLNVNDANTQIYEDGISNLTFKDAVAGTLTLSELNCPKHIYIYTTGQTAGNLDLSDGTNWNTSKAKIYNIRVVTDCTDWKLWLVRNDNGIPGDATYPAWQIMGAYLSGNGSQDIPINRAYIDEDGTNEVHLVLVDNIGGETFDIYIEGEPMR